MSKFVQIIFLRKKTGSLKKFDLHEFADTVNYDL